MIAIRLDKEIEKELDFLVAQRGSNRSAVIRDAILRYLEDNEDFALAQQAAERSTSNKSLRQLRKELGLDG